MVSDVKWMPNHMVGPIAGWKSTDPLQHNEIQYLGMPKGSARFQM